MASICLLLLAIAVHSGQAVDKVVRVYHKHEVYYGYAKTGGLPDTFKIDTAFNRNGAVVMKIFKDSPFETDREKVLPFLALDGDNKHRDLYFVDMATVSQTHTFNPNLDWVPYYVKSFSSFLGYAFDAIEPNETSVMYVLSTEDCRKSAEVKATLFTPSCGQSVLLEYDEDNVVRLGEKIFELTVQEPKLVLFVHDDPKSVIWRRMNVWFSHIGPRIVGTFLSNEVLFWIQPTGSPIRYVLPAIIDELIGTIVISPNPEVKGFNTEAKAVCHVEATNWKDMIKNRVKEDQFGINRHVRDFNHQKIKDDKKEVTPRSLADKAWSKISISNSTVDWTLNVKIWAAYLTSNDVVVRFENFGLPA